MQRKIRVDFFKVEMPPDTNFTFEELLRQLSTMPSDDRILSVENDKPFNPHIVERIGDFWQGEILLVRNTDLPVMTDSFGNPINYDLERFGLGERAIFMYHQTTKVLLLYKAKLGAPLSMISAYMKLKFNLAGEIELKPVLTFQAMEKYNKISIVKKFEIHVAGLDSPAPLNYGEADPDEVTELYEKYKSPTIALELSVGNRKDKGVDLERVKRLFNFWSKVTEETYSQRKANERLGRRATTIKITGATDEEEEFLIDLLKERIKETIVLENPNKTLPYQVIIQALGQAWSRRYDDINLLFS